jgi:isocitrate dehydrogenase kinase/phosphatase
MRIASLIQEGFDVFYGEFKRHTRECRRWFDDMEWIRMHEESQRRIDLYQQHVSRTLERLRPLAQEHPQDLELWRAAHVCYADMTRERIDCEVAETFFNAITRKIFNTVGVNKEIEFLENHIEEIAAEVPELYHRFRPVEDLEALFVDVLRVPRPALAFTDLHGEARYLAERFREAMHAQFGDMQWDRIDVLRVLFFRVREAYIVGRVHRGGGYVPLIVPIQSVPDGVVVDGAIFGAAQTREVFSSTRAYFFVDVSKPADLVGFLGSLMPELALSQLYVAIAHHRHGKTLIYRELVEHLQRSQDQFVVAPGIKGLVMTVFTMPSYRNVFKIIRDRFAKPGATREKIMRSYRDVFRGRRVGRLADTQEFEHLAFDRSRFTEECLHELLDKASQTVRVVGDKVVVSHAYIEEKMTPLNIWLVETDAERARAAIVDYGCAIKELAANDVFAGDLLWKNFGVTRAGRLVLYDYDEICPLLSCKFRRIPQARTHEEEMHAGPFYAVAESDVFPEEWAPFVVPRDRALRAAFEEHHRDLLSPEFWQQRQQALLDGELYIGLPYEPRHPDLQRKPIRRALRSSP